MCHFLWTGNSFNSCRKYIWDFNRKVTGVSLETLPGQNRPLEAHLWQAGWGLQDMQRSQSEKLQVDWILPSPHSQASRPIKVFSVATFSCPPLWEVMFEGPWNFKASPRNELPPTPDYFCSHCLSSSGTTLHLCTHPPNPLSIESGAIQVCNHWRTAKIMYSLCFTNLIHSDSTQGNKIYATCDISHNLVFELLYKNGLHKYTYKMI